MNVKFWGVRGSLPVPGRKTERYGGNTSCVEVRSESGTRVVVDAGTGIRKLGKEIVAADAGPSEVHLHLCQLRMRKTERATDERGYLGEVRIVEQLVEQCAAYQAGGAGERAGAARHPSVTLPTPWARSHAFTRSR